MLADFGPGVPAREAPNPRIAIIAALDVETAALRPLLASAAGAGIELRQSGPGAERAAAAAVAAIAAGADALLSFGYAGGLDPAVDAGTLIVPARILASAGQVWAVDSAWRAALVAALEPRWPLCEADLLSVDRVLVSPPQKQRAFAATAAAAADMESAAIAAAAAAAGLPCAVLRVVFDAAADALPANADRWIDAAGRQRWAPLAAAVFKPASWRTLAVLARRQRHARRRLRQAAARLLAAGFGRPPVPAAAPQPGASHGG